ncbi:MAG: hypothetical protein ACRCZP_19340, partial [Phycicoccus sp.]
HPSTVGASPSTTPVDDVDRGAVGSPAADEVAAALTPRRSSASTRPLAVVPRTSRAATSKPSGSTLDDRVVEVERLIADGGLDPNPSAEAIRRAVGGSAAIARAVRDALTVDPTPVESTPPSSGPVPVLDSAARGTGGAA